MSIAFGVAEMQKACNIVPQIYDTQRNSLPRKPEEISKRAVPVADHNHLSPRNHIYPRHRLKALHQSR